MSYQVFFLVLSWPVAIIGISFQIGAHKERKVYGDIHKAYTKMKWVAGFWTAAFLLMGISAALGL